MAEQRALVLINGAIQETPTGDTLYGATGGGGGASNLDGGTASSSYAQTTPVDGGGA